MIEALFAKTLSHCMWAGRVNYKVIAVIFQATAVNQAHLKQFTHSSFNPNNIVRCCELCVTLFTCGKSITL